jgi:hypothetical protein
MASNPLINDYLRQATEGCLEIAEQAEQEAAAAEALAQGLDGLAERIFTEAAAALRGLGELAAALEAWRSRVEAARGDALAHLDELARGASAAHDEAAETLAAIHGGVGALKAAQATLSSTLLEHEHAADEAAGRLYDGLDRLEAATARRLAEASERVTALRAALGMARDGFVEDARRFTAVLSQATAAAVERARDVAASLEHAVGRAGWTMVDAVNRAIAAHNAAVVDARTALTATAQSWLERAEDALRASLEAAAQASEAQGEELLRLTSEATREAEGALNALSSLADGLDGAVTCVRAA